MAIANPTVRPMLAAETSLIIDYFHDATPDFLRMLGVDPARLPARETWRAHYASEFDRPIAQRKSLLLLWELERKPIGFSTADKIIVGQQAFMHLHILQPDRRQRGFGVVLVRKSAELYFETLALQQLFCEPYAFNVAPNRTLQKAGFSYVMTHETIPGPLNFHQPVNRWVFARAALGE
jgi:RimJ/RimL family protein N-acetyltransferase